MSSGRNDYKGTILFQLWKTLHLWKQETWNVKSAILFSELTFVTVTKQLTQTSALSWDETACLHQAAHSQQTPENYTAGFIYTKMLYVTI